MHGAEAPTLSDLCECMGQEYGPAVLKELVWGVAVTSTAPPEHKQHRLVALVTTEHTLYNTCAEVTSDVQRSISHHLAQPPTLISAQLGPTGSTHEDKALRWLPGGRCPRTAWLRGLQSRALNHNLKAMPWRAAGFGLGFQFRSVSESR